MTDRDHDSTGGQRPLVTDLRVRGRNSGEQDAWPSGRSEASGGSGDGGPRVLAGRSEASGRAADGGGRLLAGAVGAG
jgi:hypothetical protein